MPRFPWHRDWIFETAQSGEDIMPKHTLIASLVCAASVYSFGASGQESAPLPDFSGLWGRNSFDPEKMPGASTAPLVNMKRLKDGTGDPDALVGDYTNPILKPDIAEVVRQKGLVSLKGEDYPDPSNSCGTYQPPFTFAMQLGLQMLQTKDEITILYNQDDQVRRVRLNQPHSLHVTPSAMGESVGHYEGDELVIDTVGVKVLPFTIADRYGTPQTERLHVVERYRLIDSAKAKEDAARHEKANGRVGGGAGAMPVDPNAPKGLHLEFFVDDPDVFTQPWTGQVTYLRTRQPWQEQVCAENIFEYYYDRDNRDVPSAKTPDF
jgi:hypothetical protein